MKDLIEALTLLLPYFEEGSYHSRNPTHCEHDVLLVFPEKEVPEDVIERLSELGFSWGEHESAGGDDCFYSSRFGSC